jgi:tRNA (cytidine/uridine-2'-O-)-methyltransferase
MTFDWPEPCFHIVLVEPEIPPNTGNIARTCAATGTALHLIEPLGFTIDDKHLKRAGLDYWPHVDITVHPSLEACLNGVDPSRIWWFSKKATKLVYEAEFKPGDWLVFGPETRGLSDDHLRNAGDQLLSLPMRGTAVRSYNLGTSVGIALFEALRIGVNGE